MHVWKRSSELPIGNGRHNNIRVSCLVRVVNSFLARLYGNGRHMHMYIIYDHSLIPTGRLSQRMMIAWLHLVSVLDLPVEGQGPPTTPRGCLP